MWLAVTVVYFSGQWCGPCAAMEPVWQEFSRGRKNAVYVDVDKPESPAYKRYGKLWEGERTMPTVVWLSSSGKLLERRSGLLGLRELQSTSARWAKHR